MFRLFAFTIVCLGASLASAIPLTAQLSTIIQRPSRSHDSAAIAAASAKADTGRMMPGYQHLSSYNTPGYCLAALKSQERLWWRTRNVDSLERFSPGDTMTTAARQLGRTCMASMTPQRVSSAQLNSFMQLAVAVGDTSLVRAVVDHQLSIAPDARARGFILLDVIRELLTARPQQQQLAEAFLKRFDPLGPDARPTAVTAYSLLYHYWARERYDTSAMIRISREKEALMAMLPLEVRQANRLALGNIFLDSVEIVMYQRIPNLRATVERLAEQGTVELPPETAAMIMAQYTSGLSLMGTPLRELSGMAWFPDSISHQAPQGKVVMVIKVDRMDNTRFVGATARYRRLYEQYKDRGLRIIFVTRTYGYRWGSPPLAAADEARVAGWFFQEYAKLPFTLVVQETPFRRISDGRRVNGAVRFEQQYGGQNISGLLVGRDGNILRSDIDKFPEAALHAWIQLALGEAGK